MTKDAAAQFAEQPQLLRACEELLANVSGNLSGEV